MNLSIKASFFIFIASFGLSAYSNDAVPSAVDNGDAYLANLVFVGAGETKRIDRHDRCILFEDLSERGAHDGYNIQTNKEVWRVLTLGERQTADGARHSRMSECP